MSAQFEEVLRENNRGPLQDIDPVLLAAKEVWQHEQLRVRVHRGQEWNHLLQPGLGLRVRLSDRWTEGRLKLALLAEVLLECEDQQRVSP